MDARKTLGSLIREARARRGWDQPHLAGRLGVSQQTLSRWENNLAVPRQSNLATLSAVLELGATEIAAVTPLAKPVGVKSYIPPLASTLPFGLLDEVQFEEFAVHLLKAQNPAANVYRNGTRGHAQHGIDVFVDYPDGSPRGGVQCKRVKEFGRRKVVKAIGEFKRSTNVASPTIYLSCGVSPDARLAVRENPPWRILGSDDLALEVIRLDIDEQLRLVDRFFPGLRESFLGIAAPSPWLRADEYRAPLTQKDAFFSQAWDLVGRGAELASLLTFANNDDQQVHVLEAAAGRGKTRLLLAVADALEEDPTISVRFLDPAQEVTAADYEVLPKTGRQFVVIEDAHRRTDLALIVRGIARTRPEARILVSMRGHNREEVDDQLRQVGVDLQSVETMTRLSDLTFSEARDLAAQVLIAPARNSGVLDALARLGVDSPFLTVVGGRLLNEGRIETQTLPGSPDLRAEILRAFRSAMVGSGTESEIELRRESLAAISAMQPFRSDQDSFREGLEALTGKKYRQVAPVLAQLEDAGLVIRRNATYRVSPDLLGDAVLSQALVDDRTGVTTSYSQELIMSLPDGPLEHALVNVGRVDAQVRQSQADSTLFEAFWDPFELSIRAADLTRRLELAALLRKIAYYQPRRVVEAVTWLVSYPFIGPTRLGEFEALFSASAPTNEDVGRALVPALEQAAHHQESLRPVMVLLRQLIVDWELPRGRSSEDPATTMLHGIFDLKRPLAYLEDALEIALGWTTAIDSTVDDRRLVMALIESLLATEVMQARSEAMTLYMTPHLIAPTAVHHIREKVIDFALNELVSGDLAAAASATHLLTEAFRTPIGMLGMRITEAQRDPWLPGSLETMQKLETLLQTQPSKAVVGAIRAALRWQVMYGEDSLSHSARELWAALPKDLRSRVAIALCDQSPGFKEDSEVEMAERRTWQMEVAHDLISAGDPPGVIEAITAELTSNRDLGWTGRPDSFVSIVFDASPDIALAIVRRSLDDPIAPLTEFVGMALQVLLGKMPNEAEEVLDRMLASEFPILRRIAATAIGWSIRVTTTMLDRLQGLLSDDDDAVVLNAIMGVRLLAETAPSEAARLVATIDFAKSSSVTAELASLFGQYGKIEFASLPVDTKRAIRFAVEVMPDIEDYAVAQLITLAFKDDPSAVIDLFQARIETQDKKSTTDFRALPFHWQAHIRIDAPAERLPILERVWRWIGADPKSWSRQHDGAMLWWALAGGPTADILEFLELKSRGSAEDFIVMGNLARDLPRTFVSGHSDVVDVLIRAAQSAGPESLRRLESGLYSSVTSGIRSRAIGVPDPEDVSSRDRFRDLAEHFSSGVTRDFYLSLVQQVESEIQWHLKDDDTLLDRHEW